MKRTSSQEALFPLAKSADRALKRVAFLFDLYQKYTTFLRAAEKPKCGHTKKK